jgi:hypothetical protein
VPDYERELRVGKLGVDDVQVGPADGTGENPQQHLAWTGLRLRQLALDERSSRPLEHHRSHDLSAYGTVLVFVDANNVRRSQWPNLTDVQLVERVRSWAQRHEHESVIVFDRAAPGGVVGSERLDERTTVVGSGAQSADEWLIGEVPVHPGAWLVTSDRALREAAGGSAGRLIGGGSFLRELEAN